MAFVAIYCFRICRSSTSLDHRDAELVSTVERVTDVRARLKTKLLALEACYVDIMLNTSYTRFLCVAGECFYAKCPFHYRQMLNGSGAVSQCSILFFLRVLRRAIT